VRSEQRALLFKILIGIYLLPMLVSIAVYSLFYYKVMCHSNKVSAAVDQVPIL
jgi:hypothetical protein